MSDADTHAHATEVESALRTLAAAAEAWSNLPAAELIDVVAATRATTATVAREWVEAAAHAKGLTLGTPVVSEEWQSGPWTLLRNLRLLQASLSDLAAGRKPRIPGPLRRNARGRVVVPTYPIDVWDRLLFPGVRAQTWMQPQHEVDDVSARQAAAYERPPGTSHGVSLVLGAGNITSIGPMDALYKLFVERTAVVLKMSPVLDYLADVMRGALRPIIERDTLRIVTGDRQVGQALVADPRVTSVHVTGSDRTYEHIQFDTRPDGQPTKSEAPTLGKPVTAELGNVTPVIIVPGPWTQRDIDYQAENLAVTLMHNAGFNCIASRVFVQQASWDRRFDLDAAVESVLTTSPSRDPYYPGARERYQALVERQPDARIAGVGETPWAVLTHLEAGEPDPWYQREVFAPVTGSVAIDSAEPSAYLRAAVEFCNDQLWGTLGVSIFIHPKTEADPVMDAALKQAIAELRYGTIAVNAWSGFGYAMTSTPWGAYPGHTPHDIQSGVGVVHNTLMLDGVEKTVVRAPWRALPKPTWFPSHRSADRVLEATTFFEADPSPWRLANVFRHALGA